MRPEPLPAAGAARARPGAGWFGRRRLALYTTPTIGVIARKSAGRERRRRAPREDPGRQLARHRRPARRRRRAAPAPHPGRRRARAARRSTWCAPPMPARAAARGRSTACEIHRRGDWRVANLVLPPAGARACCARSRTTCWSRTSTRSRSTRRSYAGRVPVVAVVPHLFGRTVYRETNPAGGDLRLDAAEGRSRGSTAARLRGDQPLDRATTWWRAGSSAARVTTIFCGLDHARFTLADPPPRDAEPAAGLLEPPAPLQEHGRGDPRLRAWCSGSCRRRACWSWAAGPTRRGCARLTRQSGPGRTRSTFRGHLPSDETGAHAAPLPRLPEPEPQGGLGPDRGRGQRLRPAGGRQRRGPACATRCATARPALLVPYGDAEAMAAATPCCCCATRTCWRCVERRRARLGRHLQLGALRATSRSTCSRRDGAAGAVAAGTRDERRRGGGRLLLVKVLVSLRPARVPARRASRCAEIAARWPHPHWGWLLASFAVYGVSAVRGRAAVGAGSCAGSGSAPARAELTPALPDRAVLQQFPAGQRRRRRLEGHRPRPARATARSGPSAATVLDRLHRPGRR